jgi:uncharacterized membrane protein
MEGLSSIVVLAIGGCALVLFVFAILMPIFVYQIAQTTSKMLYDTQEMNRKFNLLIMLFKAKNGIEDKVIKCPNPKCLKLVSYSFERGGENISCPNCHKSMRLPD